MICFSNSSWAPISTESSGSIALYDRHSGYNSEGTIIRGRTILSAARRSNNDNSYVASSDTDDGPNGNNDSLIIPTYPFLQCVAFINKTHSQR